MAGVPRAKRSIALDALFVLSAGVAIASAQWAPESTAHLIAKPLATLCMVLRIALDPAFAQRQVQRRLAIGMVAALTGDVLLLFGAQWFVYGLLSFLVAHLFFLAAFAFRRRLFWPRWPLVLLLVFGALNLSLLWPFLPALLKIPVTAYVVVLLLMAAQAIARSVARSRGYDQAKWRSGARWAALGAVLFVLSDTLLAWNRFHAPLWLGPMWILLTYYTAIFCIARCARHEPY